MKSDLEALCQTKDKILEARAAENQKQTEVIQQLEVLFMFHLHAYLCHIVGNFREVILMT